MFALLRSVLRVLVVKSKPEYKFGISQGTDYELGGSERLNFISVYYCRVDKCLFFELHTYLIV